MANDVTGSSRYYSEPITFQHEFKANGNMERDMEITRQV